MNVNNSMHRPDGVLQPGDRIWRSMLDTGHGFKSWIAYAYSGQRTNIPGGLQRSDFKDVSYIVPDGCYYACSSQSSGSVCYGLLEVKAGKPHAPYSTVIIGSCFECTKCGCQTNCADIRQASKGMPRAISSEDLDVVSCHAPVPTRRVMG